MARTPSVQGLASLFYLSEPEYPSETMRIPLGRIPLPNVSRVVFLDGAACGHRDDMTLPPLVEYR
jgi:hypothetical protein